MEKIISNPGPQHLAEKVFWNLHVDNLKICAQIIQSCKLILQHPIFCLSKFEHVSKKNQLDWVRTIKSVKNFDKGIAVISAVITCFCYILMILLECKKISCFH